jgi:hypothetical protein
MFNTLIRELEKSKELRHIWYDFTDIIVVESLKETYMNTLNGGFSAHPEDIAENLKVNEAIAVCLKYFMVRTDAEEFLKEAESERRAD